MPFVIYELTHETFAAFRVVELTALAVPLVIFVFTLKHFDVVHVTNTVTFPSTVYPVAYELYSPVLRDTLSASVGPSILHLTCVD